MKDRSRLRRCPLCGNDPVRVFDRDFGTVAIVCSDIPSGCTAHTGYWSRWSTAERKWALIPKARNVRRG